MPVSPLRFLPITLSLLLTCACIGCGSSESTSTDTSADTTSTPATPTDAIRQQVNNALASSDIATEAESVAVVIQESLESIRSSNPGKETAVDKLSTLSQKLSGVEAGQAKANLAQIKAILADLK